MLLLATPVALSIAGIKVAIEISIEQGGAEPNLLICSREDYFPAREIIKECFPQLEFWSNYAFPSISEIDWCVGNFVSPLFFVGSERE